MRQSILAALVICVCLSHVLVSADPNENLEEITPRWEKIFVNIENEPPFGLMVDPNDSVELLLNEMYELEGIPIHRVNKTQSLSTKLSEYFRDGAPMNLVLYDREERHDTTKFIVTTPDGRELPVATQLENTVSSLKDNITQWTGIAREQIRLLLRGKELKDGRKLVNHQIYNGTRLYLGRPLEECRQIVEIVVKTLSGATIEVQANLADTVNNLKERIWDKTGIPVGVQRLYKINAGVIAGEDHLCDLGLEAGSIVNMILQSSRITSLNQAARLREPPVDRTAVNNYKGPIFREADDVAEPVQSGRCRFASLFKDVRNWLTRDGPHQFLSFDLFDPVAHLWPNPDHEDAIRDNQRDIEHASHPNASDFDILEAPFNRARAKLVSALRPYRLAANLTSKTQREFPGISLGGGFTDGSSMQLVPLGADVNNWAPDTFSDSDVMRLFQVAERVRQVLASDAHKAEGTLSIASQWQINRGILLTYLEALAGYLPSVEHNQLNEDEECGVCRDDLAAEPAIKLPCAHPFHADCIKSWAINMYHQTHPIQQRVPDCPLCRQRFMFPYEALGEAELNRLELQGNQVD